MGFVEKTLKKIDERVSNENKKIILDFLDFMNNRTESTDRTKGNHLRYVIYLARYLRKISLNKITPKKLEEFVNSKRKDSEIDPTKKSITTYNDYVVRLRYFYRWLNNKSKPKKNWTNPKILNNINTRSTKNKKPTYSKSTVWTLGELQSIIKYETNLRNKAILMLTWDCDARPHELTKLQVQHIKFLETHAEGEIPFNTKTGGREIILSNSFTFCRDWLNQHPHRDNPNAYFFYDLRHTTKPMNTDSIAYVFRQLKNKVKEYYDSGIINDKKEKERIGEFLKFKRFNPYCFRTSAIRVDADSLTTSNLETKVGWTKGSRMVRTYLDNHMSKSFKRQLLARDGIVLDDKEDTKVSAVIVCNFCKNVNSFDTMVCSECGAILSQTELNRRKEEERKKERRYMLNNFRHEINSVVLNSKNLALETIINSGGELKKVQWLDDEQISYFVNQMKRIGEDITEDQIPYIKEYLAKCEPIEVYRVSFPEIEEERKRLIQQDKHKFEEIYKQMSPKEKEKLQDEFPTFKGKSNDEIVEELRKLGERYTKRSDEIEKWLLVQYVKDDLGKENGEKRRFHAKLTKGIK